LTFVIISITAPIFGVIAGGNLTTYLGCSSLTTVQISPTSKLQSISYGVFEGCVSLTSIMITSGVTVINSNAFYGNTSNHLLHYIFNHSQQAVYR
jgi:hypothetical protein